METFDTQSKESTPTIPAAARPNQRVKAPTRGELEFLVHYQFKTPYGDDIAHVMLEPLGQSAIYRYMANDVY